MEKAKESGVVQAEIEFYLGGEWKPVSALIPTDIAKKIAEGKTVLMADDDSEEIFVRQSQKEETKG